MRARSSVNQVVKKTQPPSRQQRQEDYPQVTQIPQIRFGLQTENKESRLDPDPHFLLNLRNLCNLRIVAWRLGGSTSTHKA
jgi:hypothetical protein